MKKNSKDGIGFGITLCIVTGMNCFYRGTHLLISISCFVMAVLVLLWEIHIAKDEKLQARLKFEEMKKNESLEKMDKTEEERLEEDKKLAQEEIKKLNRKIDEIQRELDRYKKLY